MLGMQAYSDAATSPNKDFVVKIVAKVIKFGKNQNLASQKPFDLPQLCYFRPTLLSFYTFLHSNH